ncbi:hypothetical protein [Streptomyces sp. 8K308]|uniref:hypothetical protein n=1 Tax=Streptomyces sp. 8K308 TaxID=2530388 RepID=UPI001A9EA729|nr:hypothetical protein [Streptomyces sp. 8K308]
MVIGWLSRLLVAAGLIGSAWVHWVVWDDWARFMDVVGPLFMVNVIAGPVIALAVLLWRGHWLPELAAVGFGLATLGAYVMSLTVGFFDVQEQFRTDEELWGVITEAACVVFGLVLLARRYVAGARSGDRASAAARRGRHRGGLQGEGHGQGQGGQA